MHLVKILQQRFQALCFNRFLGNHLENVWYQNCFLKLVVERLLLIAINCYEEEKCN